MTTRELFAMLESANEFKKMIGELRTKISLIFDEEAFETVVSFGAFERTLNDHFQEETVADILNANVSKATCVREFIVDYTFEDNKKLKLFVE